jgi:primase-polymerase (primpol)-like protein
MALCCLLAFWTGGTPTQMDRLFRRSGLYREKWDEVHYADGSTYGEKTVERAITTTSDRYDPDGDFRSTTRVGSDDTPSMDSDRGRASRSEKNRLVTERVTALKAVVEQNTERTARPACPRFLIRRAAPCSQRNTVRSCEVDSVHHKAG